MGQTNGGTKFIVIQRKAGQVTDVWWNERDGQLYDFDSACASAERDNAHGDGYVSTVCEVFED